MTRQPEELSDLPVRLAMLVIAVGAVIVMSGFVFLTMNVVLFDVFGWCLVIGGAECVVAGAVVTVRH